MMEYDNEELKDKSACSGIRADLKMCLLKSDCCKIVS
jgi:cytochrome c oxidase assembly factor 5